MQSQHVLDEVDGIVREYLTWRGFAQTLQALSQDIKQDFYSGLSSKRLVDRLFAELDLMQVENVFSWWDEGVAPLLMRVEDDVAQIGRSLRDSTFRLLLVTCFRNNQVDVILAFFSKHWPSRVGNTRFRDEWKKQWFSLPYLTTAPERDRYFSVYFSAEWKRTLFSSLESFLNAILIALPLPRLVALGGVRDVMESMRVEIEALKLSSGGGNQDGLRTSDEAEERSLADSSTTTTNNNAVAALPTTTTATAPCVDIGKRAGGICSVRYSPSCQFVAGCGRDATCVIWPSTGASPLGVKTPRLFCSATASCLDWFDDGLLCVGTLDHSLHLWRPENSNQISTLRTVPTMPHVLDCSVSGTTVACSVAPANPQLAGEVQLWDVQSETMARVLGIDPSPTRVPRLQFNHNGSLLITGATDGMVRVFDVASSSSAIMGWQVGAKVSAVCLSQSETSVFCLDPSANEVVEFSMHKVSEVVRRFALPQLLSSATTAAEIRSSANRLAVVSGDARCVVFDLVGEATTTELGNVASVDWDDSDLVCGGGDGSVRKYRF